jgi:hypothetical protein
MSTNVTQDINADVANGADNFVAGNVITSGVQVVHDQSFPFPENTVNADQHINADIANGAFNQIGGDVVTHGEQFVTAGSGPSYLPYIYGGESNVDAHQHINADVANGYGNGVYGSVYTTGHQEVHDFSDYHLPEILLPAV